MEGKNFSSEALDRMRIAKIGNTFRVGKTLSQESKDKIRIKMRTIRKDAWKKGGWNSLAEYKQFRNWQKNRWHHRRRAASGSHSNSEWETLKKQHNFTCACCKKREPEIKLTEDHIVPLSKGGSDNIENIQPLCGKCNCKKRTKTIRYQNGSRI